MTSELIVRYTCDRCSVKADEGAEFYPELRVTVGDDLDRVVDLCPGCHADVVPAIVAAFAEIGRPPDDTPSPNGIATAAITATRRRRAPSGEKDFPLNSKQYVDPRCKLCGAVTSGSNALWQHADKTHDMSRPEYRAAATRPDSALGRGVSV